VASLLGMPKMLALDWEWNNADTMTADQAATFVKRVYDRIGRWPMLYTSAAFLATIPRLVPDALVNCDLWLTGFTDSPVIPQQWAQKGWKIWQHGIGVCPGVDGQVDRDTFNGTGEELAAYFG
jgi:lysozyme